MRCTCSLYAAQLVTPYFKGLVCIQLHTSAVLFKHPYVGNDASAAEVAARGGEGAVFEAESVGWHRDIGMTEDMGHDHTRVVAPSRLSSFSFIRRINTGSGNDTAE